MKISQLILLLIFVSSSNLASAETTINVPNVAMACTVMDDNEDDLTDFRCLDAEGVRVYSLELSYQKPIEY